MGAVFSCFATSFMYAGELFENLFLAVGEVLAVVSKGLFSLLVTLCDLFAAISCCWRVPWSERPDRPYYKYDSQFIAGVGGKKILAGAVTEQGRAEKQQQKDAEMKEKELRAESCAAEKKEKKDAQLKAKQDAEKAKADAKNAKEEKAAAAKQEKA